MVEQGLVVFYGLSELTLRVTQRLTDDGIGMTIVRGNEGEDLLPRLPKIARVMQKTGDVRETLHSAGVERASALVALSDEDLDNLEAALAARELKPDLPVTIQALDPNLADQLQHGLDLRGAFSVSTLAAAAIAVSALEATAHGMATLGGTAVPVSVMTVQQGSPLATLSLAEMERRYSCVVIARRSAGTQDGSKRAAWVTPPGPEALAPGDEIVVAGLLDDILAIAAPNSLSLRPKQRLPEIPRVQEPRSRKGAGFTLLPYLSTGFLLLLALSTIFFHYTLPRNGPHDWLSAFYFVIAELTTVGANITIITMPWWIKVYTAIMLVFGAAMIGILVSHLASVAAENRIALRLGQSGCISHDHVVLCGLGKVGYRVAQHLIKRKVKLSVIDRSPDPRFVDAIREYATVLTGDVRYPENLHRASTEYAAVMVACAHDTLTNLESCLHARRMNPKIRTVARVFREDLADTMAMAFRLDSVISATKVASGVFAAAARSAHRPLRVKVDELTLTIARLKVNPPPDTEIRRRWRERGVRVIAVSRPGTPAQAATEALPPMHPGDELLLCGPAEAVSAILQESAAE